MRAKKALCLHLNYERKKSRAGFYFILPWIIGTALFFIVPLIQSIQYSFGKIELLDVGYQVKWVGFENFRYIFQKDAYFIPKATDEIRNTLLHTPLIVIFSLFIAMLLNQKFRGRTIVRAMFFLPVIIANGVIISIINGDVYSNVVMENASASQLFSNGFLNNLMLESGIPESFVTSLIGVVDSIFELIWHTGVQILIFLAGLQTVSPAMYEAASVEGATGWEAFWKITFPMVSPMLLLNVIYTIIDSYTDYSNSVMTYISSLNANMKMEISTAMAWVYFLVVIVILAVVYSIINRKVFYEV